MASSTFPPPPADHDATADDPHLPFGTRLVRFVGALMAAAPPNAPYVFFGRRPGIAAAAGRPATGLLLPCRRHPSNIPRHALTRRDTVPSSWPVSALRLCLVPPSLPLLFHQSRVTVPPATSPPVRPQSYPPRPSPPGLKLAYFRQTAPPPPVWPRQYTRLRTWRPLPVGWPSRRPPAGSSSLPPAPR